MRFMTGIIVAGVVVVAVNVAFIAVAVSTDDAIEVSYQVESR